jgi:hypothetical protein
MSQRYYRGYEGPIYTEEVWHNRRNCDPHDEYETCTRDRAITGVDWTSYTDAGDLWWQRETTLSFCDTS